jgi:hypothetical protein
VSLLPSCRDVAKLASDALDSGRELGMHARLHLSVCETCRRVAEQFALLRRAAARAPEDGPSLSDEAKARLRRSLE